MNKVLFILCVLSISVSSFAQEVDTVYVTTERVVEFDSSIRKYHNNEFCPYFYENESFKGEVLKRPFENGKIQGYSAPNVSKCQHCFDGKDFKFSKIYMGLYINHITAYNYTQGSEIQYSSNCKDYAFDACEGAVRVCITHESLTNEKIDNIKSAKAAVIVSCIASTISSTAATINAFHNNTLTAQRNLTNAHINSINARYLTEVSKEAEDFEIAVSITNITNAEMKINNESTGRCWHLLPYQSIIFGGINTYDETIRIERGDNKEVSYFYFANKNHLIKVKPTAVKNEWKYFRSYPIESSESHSIDIKKDAATDGVQYRINMRTKEFERVIE